MQNNKETVIILAGGFGTRLRQVVQDYPKVLAPVGEKFFLHYVINDLIQQGVNDIILSLFYKAELVVEFVERLRLTLGSEVRIRCVKEPAPLGTGGAIGYIIQEKALTGSVFVVNGDTYLPGGLQQLQVAARQVTNAIALVSVEDSSRYGVVETDIDNKIVEFCEKKKNSGPGRINSGVYKLDASCFPEVPQDSYSLEEDIFPSLIKNNNLFGYRVNSSFIDIGIPEDYHKFCLFAIEHQIL
jgi:D-glycero-alpha-D-manno-heptose 1-phosphate guanylyltransferase